MIVSHWPTTTIRADDESYIVSHFEIFTVHLFWFMGGDGGETKQCTLDVTNRDRGLPMDILLQHLHAKSINKSFNLE
jgi:hypothetical protein